MNQHIEIIREALLDYLFQTKILIDDAEKQYQFSMAKYFRERLKMIDEAIEALPDEEDAE